MSRNRFFGDAASYLFSTAGRNVVVPGPGQSVTCWSGEPEDLDRVQYDDLRGVEDPGTSIDAVPVLSSGQIPSADGPDDASVTSMWVSADEGSTGVWVSMRVFHKVAATGAYSDLAGKPTIPTGPGQVGADAAGAAAAAQAAAATDATTKANAAQTAAITAAATDATSKVSAETSRASAAEATKVNSSTYTAGMAAKADLVGGTVPGAQLPSFVDDVLEFANLAGFPATGESGKIYVTLDTNKTYRWSGSAYVVVADSVALGETTSTAYRGDRGKTAYDFSQAPANQRGGASGVAPLDSGSRVPDVNLPDRLSEVSQSAAYVAKSSATSVGLELLAATVLEHDAPDPTSPGVYLKKTL